MRRGSWAQYRTTDLPEPTGTLVAFYDLNGRLAYRFTENSQLTATVYRSFDTFRFPQDTLHTTQSMLFTARCSQRFGPKLSVNVTATQSDYRFFLDGLTIANTFRYRSTIRQCDAQVDWLVTPSSKHRLEVGGSLTGYSLLPGAIVPTGEATNMNAQTLPTEQSREWAGYVSEEFTSVRWPSVQAGVRGAQFSTVGPGVGYRYAEGQPRSRETITDTLRYGAGQSVSQYDGWEPRLTVRVNLLSVNSLTISYNCTR